MGLTEVKNQIVDEARKQRELLLLSAEEESRKLLHEAQKQVDIYEHDAQTHAQKMITAVERRELAAADFDGRRLLLDKKKEIMNRVLILTKEELAHISSEQRKKIIEKLLIYAKKDIDVGTIYVNKADKDHIKDKSITIKTSDIIGGLVAETGDGRVSLDLSFDSALASVREKYLQELSGVLFSG